MAIQVWSLLLICIGALIGTSLAQTGSIQTAPAAYFVRAELVGRNSAPVRFGAMELEPYHHHHRDSGVRATGDAAGNIFLNSVPAGNYELFVSGGGFLTLSRTIRIDHDLDLGTISMLPDPNAMMASCVDVIGCRSGDAVTPIGEVVAATRILEGRVNSRAVIEQHPRPTVSVSCSVETSARLARLEPDLAEATVSEGGIFEMPVPDCSDEVWAHRELQLSLKDERGTTFANLIPRDSFDGYRQSRFGIWVPLEPYFAHSRTHQAAFLPSYMDSRPIRAELSVHPVDNPVRTGGQVMINARLTNASDEVLSVSSNGFEADSRWIVTDQRGNPVPMKSRNGDAQDSRLLFPGDKYGGISDLSSLFSMDAPGIYHIRKQQMLHRPNAPGQQQITSDEVRVEIIPLTVCEVLKAGQQYDRRVIWIRASIRRSTEGRGVLFDSACPDSIHLEVPDHLGPGPVDASLQDAIANAYAVEGTISGKLRLVFDISGRNLYTFTLRRVLALAETR